jgi:hypothetical protein
MIQLNDKTIAVEVPSEKLNILKQFPGGYFFLHFGSPKMDSSGTAYLVYKHGGATHYLTPVGIQRDFKVDYEPLGLAHELGEEQCDEIVEWEDEEQYYRMYPHEKWMGDITAKESFQSLMESHGLVFENPYGDNEPMAEAEWCGNMYPDANNAPVCCNNTVQSIDSAQLQMLWREAQQKVKTYLILVKS